MKLSKIFGGSREERQMIEMSKKMHKTAQSFDVNIVSKECGL